MKLKVFSLFTSALLSFLGFTLLKNSYNMCLSNGFFCSSFFMEFLYPTMFLFGFSLFISFLIIFLLNLNFKKYFKYMLLVALFPIITSLLVPSSCSAPINLCIDRGMFIFGHSAMFFIVILLISIFQFIKNKKNSTITNNS